MNEPQACVVVTSVADPEQARNLAAIILERRLAACVQWFAIDSMYRWQGAVETAPEILVQAKTPADRVAALRQCIIEHHAYETPELIVLPIIDGAPAYLAWLRDETRGGRNYG